MRPRWPGGSQTVPVRDYERTPASALQMVSAPRSGKNKTWLSAAAKKGELRSFSRIVGGGVGTMWKPKWIATTLLNVLYLRSHSRVRIAFLHTYGACRECSYILHNPGSRSNNHELGKLTGRVTLERRRDQTCC